MHILENLTWRQATEMFKSCKTAVVPIGSTEQHGPHLPLGTDFFTAQFFSNLMAKREFNAVVTPVIPLGYADYHSDYRGTLSLTENTFELVISELCDNLIKYGIDHILFFNCHGGNSGALKRVAYKLRNRGIVAANFMWFEMAGHLNDDWKLIGHGDASETMVIMAYKPGLCDPSKAERPVTKYLTDNLGMADMGEVIYKDIMRVHFALRIGDISDNGAMLEPDMYPGADKGQWMENVSPDMAYEMADKVLDYVVGFLGEFEKIKFDKK